MKKSFLFSAIILLLLGACKKDPVPPPVSPNDSISYWKVGNYWDYLVTSGPVPRSKYVFISKIKQESMGGFSYELKTRSSYYENHFCEDGFLKSYTDNGSRANGAPYLKLDAKPGDTWEDIYTTYTMESVNDTVKVMAGVYICKKVKEVDKGIFGGVTGNTNYKYYSDQIGLIKCSGWLESYELSSTNVK